VYLALGQDAEARAAFDRMLVLDPAADLGGDVAPKIRAMVDAATADMNAVHRLTPTLVEDDGGVRLRVAVPPSLSLAGLRGQLLIGAEDQPLELVLRGHEWTAPLPASAVQSGSVRVQLVAVLSSGTSVEVTPAADAPQLAVPSVSTTLPLWARLAIGGGVIAVVAGSVALGFALSSQQDVGSVRIGVVVEE
jgi:hypothetical protein